MATTSINPTAVNVLNDFYRGSLQTKPARVEDELSSPVAAPSFPVRASADGDQASDLRRPVSSADASQQPTSARPVNLSGQELGKLIDTQA